MRCRHLMRVVIAAIGLGSAAAFSVSAVATTDVNGKLLFEIDASGQRVVSGERTKQRSTAGTGLTSLSAATDPAAAASSGLFEPWAAYPTGSWPEAVAIGDLNGDGRNDVALVTSYYFDPDNDYKLFVYLQNPDGSLAAPVKYATRGTYTGRPISVAIGDLNSDGLADVAVGLDRYSIEVYLQGNTGQLQLAVSYPTVYSTTIQIGDVNHDGRLDVVGIDWSSSYAAVLLQTESGTLAAPQTFYAPHQGYNDLELADISGDGRTDIIVMSGQGYTNGQLVVLTQSQNGGFDPAAFYYIGAVSANGIGAGDLNGDGRNDLVVSYGGNRPSSNVGVLHQNSSGTLDPMVEHASYDIPEPVEVADVNGDGRADVLTLHGGWMAMGVYLQQSDGSLAVEELYSIPYASHYEPQGLTVGDINSDGAPDAVIADYNYGLVVLRHAPGAADLAVALTGSPDPVQAYQPLTYRLHISNAGPYAAAGAVATGALPSAVEPVSIPAGCGVESGNISCLAGSLAAGSSREFEIVVQATAAGLKSLTMTVVADTADPNPANNSATVTTTVEAPNQLPVADAGADQTVKQRTAVMLDGTGSSDPDGTLVAFRWYQTAGPLVELAGADTATPGFVAPRPTKGAGSTTLGFALIVTDNHGANSVADTVSVVVIK